MASRNEREEGNRQGEFKEMGLLPRGKRLAKRSPPLLLPSPHQLHTRATVARRSVPPVSTSSIRKFLLQKIRTVVPLIQVDAFTAQVIGRHHPQAPAVILSEESRHRAGPRVLRWPFAESTRYVMHPLRSSRQKGKIIAITLKGIHAHLPNCHQNMIEDMSVSPRSSFHVLVNRARLHFRDSRGPTMYRLYVRVGTIHACAAEKFVRQLKRRTIKRKTYYSGTYDVSGQFYQKEGKMRRQSDFELQGQQNKPGIFYSCQDRHTKDSNEGNVKDMVNMTSTSVRSGIQR